MKMNMGWLRRFMTEVEPSGIVLNVVFATAIEVIYDQVFGFYGMTDSKIGVAKLEHT